MVSLNNCFYCHHWKEDTEWQTIGLAHECNSISSCFPLPLFWFRQSYNNHNFSCYDHSSKWLSKGCIERGKSTNWCILKSWFQKELGTFHKPLKATTLQGPWGGCCTQKTWWKNAAKVLVEPFAIRRCNSRKLIALHQTASVWLKLILATKQKGEGRVLLVFSKHPMQMFFEWNIFIFLVLIEVQEHFVFKYNIQKKKENQTFICRGPWILSHFDTYGIWNCTQ